MQMHGILLCGIRNLALPARPAHLSYKSLALIGSSPICVGANHVVSGALRRRVCMSRRWGARDAAIMLGPVLVGEARSSHSQASPCCNVQASYHQGVVNTLCQRMGPSSSRSLHDPRRHAILCRAMEPWLELTIATPERRPRTGNSNVNNACASTTSSSLLILMVVSQFPIFRPRSAPTSHRQISSIPEDAEAVTGHGRRE
jgi:hypothetical protein